MPEKYADSDIELSTVTKNNDKKFTALTIRSEESNISPCIYLEEFYSEVEKGHDMNYILDNIAGTYEKGLARSFDVGELNNFDAVKDKITCKLLNADYNEDYLNNKPHTLVEDLAAVYSVKIGEEANGIYSVTIDDKMLEAYGVSKETLHETAVNNLSNNDYSFKSMSETVMEMMFPDGAPENDPFAEMLIQDIQGSNLYVLTNSSGVNGAAELLNEKALNEISEKMGGDFIILPSSIHETLVVPMAEEFDRETLESMVQEVNADVVRVEDKLSDHVYQYDSKNHEIVRMDKMEEKEQAKEKVVEKTEEKSSLMDRISKKQDEISKNAAEHPHQPSKNRQEALG